MPLPRWGEAGRLDGVLTSGFRWSCFSASELVAGSWLHLCCPACREPLYLIAPDRADAARRVVGRDVHLDRDGYLPGDPLWLAAWHDKPAPRRELLVPVEPWVRDLFDALDRHAPSCPGRPRRWGEP